MDDLISRKVAIDAVKKNTFRLTFAEEQNCEGHVAWSAEAVYSDVIEGALLEFPSAQPETHEKRTETHSCDLISRQAAIDAILAVTGNSSVRELYEHVQEHGLSDMWSGGVNAAIDVIIAVPSAQPEFDKEKISELLMRLYLMGLVHLTKDSIVRRRRQHYCEELWKTIFHDDEFPVWMNWS